MHPTRLALPSAPLLALLVACGGTYPAGSVPGAGGTGGDGGGGGGGTGGDGGTGGVLPPLTCEDPACGGSPVGTWRVTATCAPAGFEPFPDVPECADEDAAVDQQVTGTASFTADVERFDLAGGWQIHLPMHRECLLAVGGGMNPGRICSQFDDSIASSGMDGGCRWDAAGNVCVCDFFQPLQETTWSRRYEVIDGELSYPNGQAPPAGFCAHPDDLSIRRPDSTFVLSRT